MGAKERLAIGPLMLIAGAIATVSRMDLPSVAARDYQSVIQMAHNTLILDGKPRISCGHRLRGAENYFTAVLEQCFVDVIRKEYSTCIYRSCLVREVENEKKKKKKKKDGGVGI